MDSRMKYLLAIIVFLALGLRLWGINFGLPYEYHIDEVQYVRQAAKMGSIGLEPTWWNNPPFHKYMLLGEYAGLYVIGRLSGTYNSLGDFGNQLTLDPTWLYLIGRGTSALLGTLTVLLVFWIGRIAYKSRVGLIAAFLMAGSFIVVREAHYAVNDTALTFWITLCVLAGLQISRTGKFRWYAISAIAIGIGFATKYSALAAGITLVLGHLFSPGKPWQKSGLVKLLGAAGLAVFMAILASPYFVITPGKVISDVYEALYLAGKNGFDGWQIDPAGGYIFYLKTIGWGMGIGLALLALIGLIAALIRHQPVDLLLAALPILWYIALGHQKMYFARFILPIIPPLLVLGAAWLDRVATRYIPKKSWQNLALVAIVVLLVAPTMLAAIRSDILLTHTDTRTLAKSWIEANIPQDTRIALDWEYHSVPLSTQEKPFPDSERVYQAEYIGKKGLSDHPLDWYRTNGFEYLVVSSDVTRIPLVDTARNERRDAFYASLDQELTRMAEFRPTSQPQEPAFIFDEVYGPAVSLWDRDRPGPTIIIYRLDTPSSGNTLNGQH
jgi:hypothetical protein